MLEALLMLIVVAIFTLFWSANRDVAEVARRHGRAACSRAGVQWLDQNVVLTGMALRRDDGGRLRLARRYGFEYSNDGINRERGSMLLLGRDLQWITDPQPKVDALN